MIRPFTCICMLLAAGAGLYLYQTKHRAQLLDREIARTYKQIEQTKDRIGVLKGEWALLNEPERLAELARQHLALRTLAPTQFVALADLGNRLPAPLPPGSFLPAPDDAPATAVTAPAPAPAPPAALPIAAVKPTPSAGGSKAPAPVQLAALPSSPVPSPPTPRQSPRTSAPVATAPLVPAPAAPASAQTLAAPRIMAPIVNVSASPIPPPHPAPAPVPAQFGSALGSAGHVPLPAPVPYASSASR